MNRQETLGLEEPQRLLGARDEPRVWVEELRIFEKPGELIRSVPFRRGVNFVWAPDESTDGRARGHDSGKTLLCRLLRFALGEDAFADRTETKRIRRSTPDGFVAAHVHVAGSSWWVGRPLGSTNSDRAVRSADFDALSQTSPADAGMADYRAALRDTLGGAERHIPNEVPDSWLASLEWVARDQRCLNQPLIWRGTRNAPWRSVLAQALLRLVPDAAVSASRGHDTPDVAHSRHSEALAEARTHVERLEAELSSLGAGVSRIAPLTEFQQEKVVQERRDVLRRLPERPRALAEAEADRRKADEVLATLLAEVFAAEANEVLRAKCVANLAADVRDFQEQATDQRVGGMRRCKLCLRVLKDREEIEVHAAVLSEKVAAKREEHARAVDDHGLATTTLGELKRQVAEQRGRLAALEENYRALRDSHESNLIRQGEEAAAVDRKLSILAALRKARGDVEKLVTTMPAKPASPRFVADPVCDPSQWASFAQALDIVTRQLFGAEASSRAELRADGFHFEFREHGNHRAHGPGLTALGAIAFDLAALRMAISDKADLPGFWIHDSPRDANLGPGRFASLLDALLELHEEFGQAFQYILTSTDAPPERLRGTPFDRIHLGSASDDELLLRRRYR